MLSVMKKLVVLICLFALLLPLSLGAQTINLGNALKYKSVKLEAVVIDSLSRQPVEFASSYIVRQGDSTILNFALSGKDGSVTFDQVSVGKYVIYVEQLGYKPFAMSFSIPEEFTRSHSLGSLAISPDPEQLAAARVSGEASPITMVKDTVVYNAGSFKVGDDAKLGELLSKMPGIEVGSGGLKVNGSEVKNITIGGRTFFLNDPMMAVNTIPAKIVRNVKVYESDPENSSGTMVSGTEKETVMDIALKPEYEEGFFGSLSFSGAYEMQFLGNADVMASHFAPNEQLTFVANAITIDDPFNSSALFMAYGALSNSLLSSRSGLDRSALAGANIDTDKFKKSNVNASVKYNYSNKIVADTISRDYILGDKLASERELLSGTEQSHNVKADLRLGNRDKSKYNLILYVNTAFKTGGENATSVIDGSVADGSVVRNSSFYGNSLQGNVSLNVSSFNLGKPGRSIMTVLNGNASYSGADGNDDAIAYERSYSLLTSRLMIQYVEPLGDKIAIQFIGEGNLRNTNSQRHSEHSFYSYDDINTTLRLAETVRLRLITKKAGTLYAGAKLDQNRIMSRSASNNDWDCVIAPNLEYNFSKNAFNLKLYTIGNSNSPYADYLIPKLDISNPGQFFVGNPDLRSTIYNTYMFSLRYNNRKTRLMLSTQCSAGFRYNPLSNLVWYNSSGTRFTKPINLTTPDKSLSLGFVLSLPLDSKARLMWNVSPSVNGEWSCSKRVSSVYEGDLSYAEVNEWLRNEASITSENRSVLSAYISSDIAWNGETFSARGGISYSRNDYKWAESSYFNSTLSSMDLNASVDWHLPASWNIRAKVSHGLYFGYPEQFSRPQTLLDLKLSKTLGRFVLSATCADILDSRNAFYTNVSPTVMEITQRLSYRRRFMIGISFDFGKFNAMQGNKASMAASSMMMK